MPRTKTKLSAQRLTEASVEAEAQAETKDRLTETGDTQDVFALYDEMSAGKVRHTEGRLRAVAEAGLIPPPPDFSAETHKRFRGKLATVMEAIKACDIAALQAIEIKPISSSPKALARFRDAAVIALTKQAEPSA